jgi:hypothetical protein
MDGADPVWLIAPKLDAARVLVVPLHLVVESREVTVLHTSTGPIAKRSFRLLAKLREPVRVCFFICRYLCTDRLRRV